MSLAFGGGAKKMMKGVEKASTRTWYFAFASKAERDDFFDTAENNVVAAKQTPEYLNACQNVFKNMIKRVGGNVDAHDISALLDQLYGV